MSTVAAAIPTQYKGHLFRSRLEARWAVFFDALGIEWQYEPQGYMVGVYEEEHLRKYLPDFYLPELEMFVEVKGDRNNMDWTLLGDACDGWSRNLGNAIDGYGGGAVLVLGNIPDPDTRWAHVLVHNMKGARATYVEFVDIGWKPRHLWKLKRRINTDAYYDASWTWGEEDRKKLSLEFGSHVDHNGIALGGKWASYQDRTFYAYNVDEQLKAAYTSARSARFEHGHSGATL